MQPRKRSDLILWLCLQRSEFTNFTANHNASTLNVCHLLPVFPFLFPSSPCCSLEVKKTSVHRSLKAKNTISSPLSPPIPSIPSLSSLSSSLSKHGNTTRRSTRLLVSCFSSMYSLCHQSPLLLIAKNMKKHERKGSKISFHTLDFSSPASHCAHVHLLSLSRLLKQKPFS